MSDQQSILQKAKPKTQTNSIFIVEILKSLKSSRLSTIIQALFQKLGLPVDAQTTNFAHVLFISVVGVGLYRFMKRMGNRFLTNFLEYKDFDNFYGYFSVKDRLKKHREKTAVCAEADRATGVVVPQLKECSGCPFFHGKEFFEGALLSGEKRYDEHMDVFADPDAYGSLAGVVYSKIKEVKYLEEKMRFDGQLKMLMEVESSIPKGLFGEKLKEIESNVMKQLKKENPRPLLDESKLPPIPWHGGPLSITGQYWKDAETCRKELGGTAFLKIFSQDIVVCSDSKLWTEAQFKLPNRILNNQGTYAGAGQDIGLQHEGILWRRRRQALLYLIGSMKDHIFKVIELEAVKNCFVMLDVAETQNGIVEPFHIYEVANLRYMFRCMFNQFMDREKCTIILENMEKLFRLCFTTELGTFLPSMKGAAPDKWSRSAIQTAAAEQVGIYSHLLKLTKAEFHKHSESLTEELPSTCMLELLYRYNKKCKLEDAKRHLVSMKDSTKVDTDFVPDALTESDIIGICYDWCQPGVWDGTKAQDWVLAVLLNQEKHLKMAIEEVEDVTGGNSRWVTTKDIEKMHYLQACVMEAFRFRCATPVVPRQAGNAPVKIGGYEFPAFTQFVFSLQLMNQQEETFVDAKEYKPERWISSTGVCKFTPSKLHTFGGGLRACAGSHIANQNTMMQLAVLFQNFNISSAEGPPDLNFYGNGLTIRAKPFKIRMEPKWNAPVLAIQRNIDSVRRSKQSDNGRRSSRRTGMTVVTHSEQNRGNTLRVSKPIARLSYGRTAIGSAVAASKLSNSVNVFFCSQSGSTKSLAYSLLPRASQMGISMTINNLRDFDAMKFKDILKIGGPVLFVVSTFYEGEPPNDGKVFHEYLLKLQDDALKEEFPFDFAVFGAGSSLYEYFCEFGKQTDQHLERVGGRRMLDLAVGDSSAGCIENDFSTWAEKMFLRMCGVPEGDNIKDGNRRTVDDHDILGEAPVNHLMMLWMGTDHAESSQKSDLHGAAALEMAVDPSLSFQLLERKELRIGDPSVSNDGGSTMEVTLKLPSEVKSYQTAGTILIYRRKN